MSANQSPNSYSETELRSLGLIRCPYVWNHVMKTSKFQNHLNRCFDAMNVSDQKQWTVCPFNYSHRIRSEDYSIHLIECEDNRIRDLKRFQNQTNG